MHLVGYFFFQAEDGIRDLVRSRGLGDVYKRQDFIRFLQNPDFFFGDFSENTNPETRAGKGVTVENLSLIHI